MKRTVIKTKDGSSSIFVPELDESFHSLNGAYTESMHVFIDKGLRQRDKKELKILEIGFGTGLNCILTCKENITLQRQIHYHAIELFPITTDEMSLLDFNDFLDENFLDLFRKMHLSAWDEQCPILDNFILKKLTGDLQTYKFENNYDLIYFDAFAPNKQAEMWTPAIFQKMYDCLCFDGLLVTYCAKGEVRRIMQSVGFAVERTDGPPGKREMLVATKKIL